MRTSIKRVSGESSDGQLHQHERRVAGLEQLAHHAIALGGYVRMSPEERELPIEPIQNKKNNAFSQCSHVLRNALLLKVVRPRLFELRNLRTVKLGGSAVRTGRNETRFVLTEVKFQSRSSSGERGVQVASLAPIRAVRNLAICAKLFEIRGRSVI